MQVAVSTLWMVLYELLIAMPNDHHNESDPKMLQHSDRLELRKALDSFADEQQQEVSFSFLSSISELEKDKDVVKRVFPGNGAC